MCSPSLHTKYIRMRYPVREQVLNRCRRSSESLVADEVMGLRFRVGIVASGHNVAAMAVFEAIIMLGRYG